MSKNVTGSAGRLATHPPRSVMGKKKESYVGAVGPFASSDAGVSSSSLSWGRGLSSSPVRFRFMDDSMATEGKERGKGGKGGVETVRFYKKNQGHRGVRRVARVAVVRVEYVDSRQGDTENPSGTQDQAHVAYVPVGLAVSRHRRSAWTSKASTRRAPGRARSMVLGAEGSQAEGTGVVPLLRYAWRWPAVSFLGGGGMQEAGKVPTRICGVLRAKTLRPTGA